MSTHKAKSAAIEMTQIKSQDMDDLQLRAQGHPATLPRQFSMLSMVAFSFSIMNSWTGIVSLLVTNLTFGGPPAAFWIPIASSVTCGIISTGLAELASAFPSAGGQYHFAFMVTPPRYRATAAFVTGWLNILAYLFTMCSGTIYPAQLIATVTQVYNPGYVVERWHIYFIYVAILVISAAVVIFWSSLIPSIQSVFFWASVLAVFSMSITLLAASPIKQRAETVLVAWTNTSGWSTGFGFMLAMGQGMWLYVCVDSATHVSEEIHSPGNQIPRAMILSIVIGTITNVVFSLAILFSVNDFDAVSSSPLPIYEVFHQVIGSYSGDLFLMIWLIFVYIGCVSGLVVTTGRLIWAFARDDGMPFSPIFDHIHDKLKVLVEASVLSCAFCILYGLIDVGNTVAFNTFISTAILFINLSYAIPQGMVLWTGRKNVLPERYLDLGNIFGPFCNAFTVAWMALYTVLFCFPLTLPTDSAAMNYVSVVLVVVMIFIAMMWFIVGKKKSFAGPKVQLEIISAVNAPAVTPTVR